MSKYIEQYFVELTLFILFIVAYSIYVSEILPIYTNFFHGS